jgi:hypothetical protein
MNSYQMVLHRPVETAGLFGNFETDVSKQRPSIAESILTMGQYREVGFSGVTAKDPQVIPRSDRFGTDKRQEEKQLVPATVELN